MINIVLLGYCVLSCNVKVLCSCWLLLRTQKCTEVSIIQSKPQSVYSQVQISASSVALQLAVLLLVSTAHSHCKCTQVWTCNLIDFKLLISLIDHHKKQPITTLGGSEICMEKWSTLCSWAEASAGPVVGWLLWLLTAGERQPDPVAACCGALLTVHLTACCSLSLFSSAKAQRPGLHS